MATAHASTPAFERSDKNKQKKIKKKKLNKHCSQLSIIHKIPPIPPNIHLWRKDRLLLTKLAYKKRFFNILWLAYNVLIPLRFSVGFGYLCFSVTSV